MKFKIFSTWELCYRKFIFLLIIIISFLSIYWYFTSEDVKKSDTSYIVSILYALFLFFIGVYDNYMKSKIDDKFYTRKDYYLNLLKLKSLFDKFDLSGDSDEEVFNSILFFKMFTGRGYDFAYISEQGFKFNDEELYIEDKFIRHREKILEKLNYEILQYIDHYSISKKYLNPSIDKVYFSVEEWCIENVNATEKELKDIEDYIYRLLFKFRHELDELQIMINKIIKKYKSYKLEIEWNIKIMENTYGKKLKYDFLQENKFINELRCIRKLIAETQTNMCLNNETLLNSNNEIKDEIHSLYKDLILVKNNLSIDIFTIKDELIDELSD